MSDEMKDKERTLKKIRSGLFDRSMSLTKLAVQSGAHLAMTGIKGAFSDASGRDQQLKSLMNVQAKLLTHELGRLKGSLMKVGQMLALYGEHFLPEEIVDQLKGLNESSPPVEWREIDRLLRQRLRRRASDLRLPQRAKSAIRACRNSFAQLSAEDDSARSQSLYRA